MRSYRTFSPLPVTAKLALAVCFLWHFPASHLDRSLTGILPYEARTFLPPDPPSRMSQTGDLFTDSDENPRSVSKLLLARKC